MQSRRNGDYWRERFRKMEEIQNERSIEKAKEIQEQFDRTLSELDKKINVWYQRLADNNDVSLAEAKRMLDKKELREFRWSVEEYIKYGKENDETGQWVKELENASSRVHIGWLEARKMEIRAAAEKLYGKYAGTAGEHIRNTYTDNYYRTAYEIRKRAGIDANIQALDENMVEKIISNPWAVDGKNFSERIWQDKKKLINTMHQSLTRMCITGEPPDAAVSEIAKAMNASKKRAWTLVMTETAAFSNKARQECMDDLNVEEYEVVETFDDCTCSACGTMDGKHYRMDEFEIGVTAPPFHPNCRGCTAPYFNDEFTAGEKRVARNEEGNTYQVPSDMTYDEWKKIFIDGDEPEEKDIQNDTAVNKYGEEIIFNLGDMPKDAQEYVKRKVIELSKMYKTGLREVRYSGRRGRSGEKGSVDATGSVMTLNCGGAHSVEHEFFHTLDFSKRSKEMYKGEIETDVAFWKEARQLFREYKKACRDTDQRISLYSMENVDEFFAEAFSIQKGGSLADSFGGNKCTNWVERANQITDKYFKQIPEEGLAEASDVAAVSAVDITSKWTKTKGIKGVAKEKQEYIVNGTTYKVDGKHVILRQTEKEREVAAILSGKYGKVVEFVPQVMYPLGIQTPDYMIDGDRFDLKCPTGRGKNLLYGMLAKKKKQSPNFLFDISECPLSEEDVIRQIEGIYASRHTSFVEKIVVVKKGEILKVFDRK